MILFPQGSVERIIAQEWSLEAKFARQYGAFVHLLDLDALSDDKPNKAVRNVPQHMVVYPAIYRGPVLSIESYSALYKALDFRNIRLINDPTAYFRAHDLHSSYPFIKDYTSCSVFLPKDQIDDDRIVGILNQFNGPVVVRDWTNSSFDYWSEANFVPEPTAGLDIVRRFLGLKGTSLIGGLAFREFLQLDGENNTQNKPQPLVYRLFLHERRLIYLSMPPGSPLLPDGLVEQIVSIVPDGFVAVDLVREKVSGRFLVLEVEDGQVSRLRGFDDPMVFVRNLLEITRPRAIQ